MISRKRREEMRKRPMIVLKKFNKFITEDSLSDDKRDKIVRFRDPKLISSSLKDLTSLVKEIKESCIQMDYMDFILNIDKDNFIIVRYTAKINRLLNLLIEGIESCEDINVRGEIENIIFSGGYTDPFLDVEVNTDKMNQIDIMNGLPNFMKGIGIGKKLYKRLIREFDYITSFSGNDPSLDSNMVWNSLLSDKELFSFTQDNNILVVWKDVGYESIIDKLKMFLKSKSNINIDDDFLIKYDLDEQEFLDSILL